MLPLAASAGSPGACTHWLPFHWKNCPLTSRTAGLELPDPEAGAAGIPGASTHWLPFHWYVLPSGPCRVVGVVAAVLYAMRCGCLFPVPEPDPKADPQAWIQWVALRNLHDAVDALSERSEAP